jgi:hypothetical protein
MISDDDSISLGEEDEDEGQVSDPQAKAKGGLTDEQRAAKNEKDRQRRAAKKAAEAPPKKVPKHDIAKQVKKLGQDSLAPPDAAKKPKKAVTSTEAAKVVKAKAEAPKKVHGVTKKPKAKTTTMTKPKRVEPKVDVIMSHTYQRQGQVAAGTDVRGGAKQMAILFPAKMFAKLAVMAKRNGISFGEQVRQVVQNGLAGA